MADPFDFSNYYELSKIYEEKGNRQQALICLQQAFFYAKQDTDRERIKTGMERLRESGVHVPKTAIVILSWNLLDYTRQCINSIRQTTSPDDTQIVVVDNASEDGSVEWLRQQDDLTLFCSDENLGFPAGCNRGIGSAEKDADILLLNNDTVLPFNALFWLKMGLYENERIGSTGSMSNYVSNDQMIDVSLATPREVLDYAIRQNVPMDHPYIPKIYLVGFSLLLKRCVLDEVGLLDERFSPGNSEDIDIGIRMRMAGYENLLCKNSIVLHFGSQSFQKTGDAFKHVMLRNLQRLNEKYGADIRYYLFPRKELADHFRSGREDEIRVLELGCGTGATMAYIRGSYPNAVVYGIEIVPDIARIAASVGNVVCGNAEEIEFPYEEDFFDYCVMGDVLEHLHEPKNVLRKLSKHMKEEGRIILSMPNMKHWSVMVPLLIMDRFTYEDAGILDRTHLKMYTKREILKLVKDAGYDVEDVSEKIMEECPQQFSAMIDTLRKMDQSGNANAYNVYQYVVTASKSRINPNLDANKICIITAVNDDEMYQKCLDHLNLLNEPDGMVIDAIAIRGADSMTSAYNEAMQSSDAKYKVYIHQDVMITDPDFLVTRDFHTCSKCDKSAARSCFARRSRIMRLLIPFKFYR